MNRVGMCVAALFVFAFAANGQRLTFTTFAGPAGGPGSIDGPGTSARLNGPYGVATDAAGNVYVADSINDTIRKITPAGDVSTVAGLAGAAGTVDGRGSAARFDNPRGIAVDGAGNVYVAEYGSHTIRKITPAGTVSTLAGTAGTFGSADGAGSVAQFHFPQAIAVDAAANAYVADVVNSTIRRIAPDGTVSTLAGLAGSTGNLDGTGTSARFNFPWSLTCDASGTIYVADTGNGSIRKVTAGGVVTTVATAAQLGGRPAAVAIGANNTLYVALDNQTVVTVSSSGVVSPLAGSSFQKGDADGTGSVARFSDPSGVAFDGSGNLFVGDSTNSAIRKIVVATGAVTTFAGLAAPKGNVDGSGTVARFNNPFGVATDGAGNVYVADTFNNAIRKITPAGVVNTLAGGTGGSADGVGAAAQFSEPAAVATDAAGNVYVIESLNDTVRKVTSDGTVTTLAGLAGASGSADGSGTSARFYAPNGIAADAAGNVYVADTGNHTIRKVTGSGAVTTVAGVAGSQGNIDGTRATARFSFPYNVAIDTTGTLFVSSNGQNGTIRKVSTAGDVTTLAGSPTSSGSTDGTGSAALFNVPNGMAVAASGNIYVADSSNGTIRLVTPTGTVTTVAGAASPAGMTGMADGTADAARFWSPQSVAIDPSGNIYVCELGGRIRIGRTALGDRATIDAATGAAGVARQLDSLPRTATSCTWEIIRRPSTSTAALSSTTICNPAFTPDAGDLFMFRLTASDGVHTSITTVSLVATSSPHGDVNGDGRVNVADVFYLINRIFAGGPAPVGPADVNGDGFVSTGDIFYLVSYLFAGGSGPK